MDWPILEKMVTTRRNTRAGKRERLRETGGGRRGGEGERWMEWERVMNYDYY